MSKRKQYSANNNGLISNNNYPLSLKIEPSHLKINLNFKLPEKIVNASVSTTVKAKVRNADSIEFDAIDLNIRNVYEVNHPESTGNKNSKFYTYEDYDEEPPFSGLKWNYDGKKLKLTWNKPFEENEEREVYIGYSINEPVSGIYFFVPDEAYTHIQEFAFIDNETEKARYWLPCIDHPSVRTTIDYHITSKIEHTILANGKLISETENENGTKTAHWHVSFPCPTYIMTVAVGEFISYNDTPVDLGYGEIPVTYFALKDYTPDDLKHTFDRTPKMLEWLYNKLKIQLPYPKYFQYVTPHSFGAMENLSLVSWDDSFILDEVHNKELVRSVDQINAHEVSHSWFGNLVGGKDFSHVWLKEAWATYLEMVWFEDTYGSAEFCYKLFEASEIYFLESSDTDRPIVTRDFQTSWELYSPQLYQGAAWRMHMLRQLIGDEIFWESASDYLRTFRFKTLETIDFQRILEKHSKISLQKFFDQWIYKSGYPALKAFFEYDEEKHLCCLRIEQVQSENSKNKQLFEFPLDIIIEKDKGNYDKFTFEINQEEQSFYFYSENKPLVIQFDPEIKILYKLEFNPGRDILKHQLEYGNIVGRILAARELAKAGGKENIKILSEAYRNEKFWGVRVQIAKALGEAESFDAVEEIISLLKTERSPLVLRHLLYSLKNKRDETVANAVFDFLKNCNYLYDAIGIALNVIGSQQKEEYFRFLVDYDTGPDRKKLIRTAKYYAIGKLRTPEALEFLLEKVKYGLEPYKVRLTIISAITECALWLEKRYKEKAKNVLIDILRKEKNELILRTTISQLCRFRDKGTIPTLEMAKNKIEHGEHPSINRQIESVLKGENFEEDIKNLRKEIEELKLSNKKLVSRLEKFEATY